MLRPWDGINEGFHFSLLSFCLKNVDKQKQRNVENFNFPNENIDNFLGNLQGGNIS